MLELKNLFPGKLKIIIIFFVSFFVLLIIFNIWMRKTLKQATSIDLKVSRPAVQFEKDTYSPIKYPEIIEESNIEETKEQFKDTGVKKRRFLIQ